LLKVDPRALRYLDDSASTLSRRARMDCPDQGGQCGAGSAELESGHGDLKQAIVTAANLICPKLELHISDGHGEVGVFRYLTISYLRAFIAVANRCFSPFLQFTSSSGGETRSACALDRRSSKFYCLGTAHDLRLDSHRTQSYAPWRHSQAIQSASKGENRAGQCAAFGLPVAAISNRFASGKQFWRACGPRGNPKRLNIFNRDVS